jgi:16S rRNA (guanine(966)-N(2))-methyltransferase RsmD
VNSKYGNADITMQMVKEAFFDIVSPYIRESAFLDLFACSGQIGCEAYSRGAASVHLNEKDRRRYSFIADFVKTCGIGATVSVSNSDAFALLKRFHAENALFDIVYADPPYVKEGGFPEVYERLLSSEDLASVMTPGGMLVVQHFTKNVLPEKHGLFERFDARTYGQNTLTFYRK